MVQFQIVDILSDDIPNDKKKEFQISIYGKTTTNQSIICNVIGFKPYFCLKIPDHWKSQTISMFLKEAGNPSDDPSDDPTIQSFITGTAKYDPTLDLLDIKDYNIVEYTELYGQIEENGPVLMECQLPCGHALVSGWVGARLTLMMDRVGRNVLRMKLDMPPESDEEE